MNKILLLIILFLSLELTSCKPKDPVINSNMALGSFRIGQKLKDCEPEAIRVMGAFPIDSAMQQGMFVKKYHCPSFHNPIEVITSPNDHLICEIKLTYDGGIDEYSDLLNEFSSLFPYMDIDSRSEEKEGFDYLYCNLRDTVNGDRIKLTYQYYNGTVPFSGVYLSITNSEYADYILKQLIHSHN